MSNDTSEPQYPPVNSTGGDGSATPNSASSGLGQASATPELDGLLKGARFDPLKRFEASLGSDPGSTAQGNSPAPTSPAPLYQPPADATQSVPSAVNAASTATTTPPVQQPPADPSTPQTPVQAQTEIPVSPVQIQGTDVAAQKGLEQVYLDEGITGVGKTVVERVKKKGVSFMLSVIFIILILVGAFWVFADPNSGLNKIALEEQNSVQAKNSDQEVINNPPPAELENRSANLLQQQGFLAPPTDSVCGLPPGSVDFEAPFDISLVHADSSLGALPPVSDVYGGLLKKSGVLNTCYQFSTQGAALAAANFIGFMESNRPDVETILFENAISNSGLPFSPSQTSEISQDVPSIKIVGYQITNTFIDATTVDVGISIDQEGQIAYYHISVPLVWKSGDWKMVAKNGQIDLRFDQIGSLKGYLNFY